MQAFFFIVGVISVLLATCFGIYFRENLKEGGKVALGPGILTGVIFLIGVFEIVYSFLLG
ncbi:MAG: hypothetical protein COV69_04515 [Parcubacteria group bacterium CG11_big_fil_rev_8_21_14_0_20_39_14]|nr:MAG: hypothetical protein COV69_04515 [Parcubacteria group bacterium CG11_big_fil_rev_8_21_14_0_20_39_14]PIS35239.1 MAG: hypothetical protein COT36_03465 [Parcubacteria group bacterium CG08_land_8_20_14_0_20_38_56]